MDADSAVGRLGEFAGGIVDDIAGMPLVRLAGLAVAGYASLVWLAAAWWTMQDLRRRHGDPALPYLAAGLVVLASPLLFPLALVIYHIVRPARTLAESRRLALEVRLDELEVEGDAPPQCRGCAAPIEADWLRCPACRSRLGYACAGCGRAMGADWDVCAWCGAEVGDRPRVADAVERPAPPAGVDERPVRPAAPGPATAIARRA